MKWLWITALLFLVTEVKSGPTRKDGMLDVLGISKIERDDQGAFIFTLNTTTSVNTTHSILVVRVIDHEYGFRSENSTPSTLLTFKADLTQFSGSDVEFMILVKNKAEEDVGAATLDIHFPDFPGGTTTQNLFDPRDLEPDIKKKKILLRVAGSLGDMRPQTGESLIIGDINYFAFPNISSVDYVPWNKSNGVDVCDKELDQPETTGTVIGPTVSSAVLAYGPKPNATIKLSFLNAEEIQDAILIPQLSNSFERNVLCTLKQFDEETCTIDWSDQGYTGLRLIITQKTTGTAPDLDTWETYSFDIHDRELVATQLGADIIEGRWLMLGGEYSADQTGKSVYRLRKSAFGENLPQDIDVDCSHLSLEPKLCFGYFPHLVKDKTYTLTVAYKESDKANEMDQIESSPVKIKASEPELEILSRHTTTHRNQQKADVQICFQHLTPTEGRSFSHYEMLIINEKGQWLKHRIMQEEEEEEEEEGDASEERLCFAPFTISTKDFDLTEGTKVVVSQRAVDGVSVLASGESALF